MAGSDRLLEPLGIKAAFSPLGITLALMFIGIPFVVRTVQPVLEDAERDTEEAAPRWGQADGERLAPSFCQP